MRLVWHNSHLRAAAALLAVASVLVSAGLWLPLGISMGVARRVPEWSHCGQALCTCMPNPTMKPDAPCCPLCAVGAKAKTPDGRHGGPKAQVRMRLDLTPVGNLRNKFAFLGGFFLVGVLGTEACVRIPPLNDAGTASLRLALAQEGPMRETPTPPPRA